MVGNKQLANESTAMVRKKKRLAVAESQLDCARKHAECLTSIAQVYGR